MAAADPIPFAARTAAPQDFRFCPYCGQMSFDVLGQPEGFVYCEFCGLDIAVADLVKTA